MNFLVEAIQVPQTQPKKELPGLPVLLELDPSLDTCLDADNHLSKVIRLEISQKLAQLLETLGIPGHPVIYIDSLIEQKTHGRMPIRIALNGQVYHYSRDLLQNIYTYLMGAPPDNSRTSEQILNWLKTLVDNNGVVDSHNHKTLIEFLSLACLGVAKKWPAALLGEKQVDAYKNSLRPLKKKIGIEWDSWPDNNGLQNILARILNLRISIANKEVVAETLQKGFSEKHSPSAIVEDLVLALQPNVVEIQLPQDYLRELTMENLNHDEKYFALMRDGLFYELGVRYPEIKFVLIDNLRPNSMAFRINHLNTMPRMGLAQNELLVNDTSDRLMLLNIRGKPAINPANGIECSIIDKDFQDIAEGAGLTTWNPMGFLCLSLSSELRSHSECFLNREIVFEEQERLAQAFPALVTSVRERFSIEKTTEALRFLVSEEISLRNLRLVLELMLDFDHIVTDDSEFIIFDDRLPTHISPDKAWLDDPENLTAFIRTGLKRYISYKYTRGGNTLVVYLVDREIEGLLAKRKENHIPLTEKNLESILEAVNAEVSSLLSTASTPTILTTLSLRSYIRELIEAEFPRLPVVAYQELSPDMNIQPIARISPKL
jgi:flagellar biosynthesis component FlhA